MSLRGDVENAVVKLLGPLIRTAEGGYLAVCSPYGGDLTPGREGEDWQRITQGAHPVILVQSAEGGYENRTMGRSADYVLEMHVLIGTDNPRAQVAMTQGDSAGSADPGVYQIIDDVRDRLFNRPLEDAAGACTLRPISDTPILRAPDRLIWDCVYECRVDALESDLQEFDGDYLILHSEINFPAADDGAPANPVLEFEQDVTPPT